MKSNSLHQTEQARSSGLLASDATYWSREQNPKPDASSEVCAQAPVLRRQQRHPSVGCDGFFVISHVTAAAKEMLPLAHSMEKILVLPMGIWP